MIQTNARNLYQKSRSLFGNEHSGLPGWINFLIQPGKKPLQDNPIMKGGEKLNILFGFKKKFVKIRLMQERRGRSRTQNSVMDEKQKVEILIRAAKRACQGGNKRLLSPDPTPAEQLGIRINVLRRNRQKSLKWVSEKTGYPPDELVAFEAGILPNQRMLEMLPEIMAALELTTPENLPALSRFSSKV